MAPSDSFGEEITGAKATKPKTILVSSSGEDGSCSSRTKQDRRTTARKNLFVSSRRVQEVRSKTRSLS